MRFYLGYLHVTFDILTAKGRNRVLFSQYLPNNSEIIKLEYIEVLQLIGNIKTDVLGMTFLDSHSPRRRVALVYNDTQTDARDPRRRVVIVYNEKQARNARPRRRVAVVYTDTQASLERPPPQRCTYLQQYIGPSGMFPTIELPLFTTIHRPDSQGTRHRVILIYNDTQARLARPRQRVALAYNDEWARLARHPPQSCSCLQRYIGPTRTTTAKELLLFTMIHRPDSHGPRLRVTLVCNDTQAQLARPPPQSCSCLKPNKPTRMPRKIGIYQLSEEIYIINHVLNMLRQIIILHTCNHKNITKPSSATFEFTNAVRSR